MRLTLGNPFNTMKSFCPCLEPMLPPKPVDNFPLEGRCSEGLDTFRFFFKLRHFSVLKCPKVLPMCSGSTNVTMIYRFHFHLCYVILSSLHQSHSQHQPSRVRPVNAETFDHTSIKSTARLAGYQDCLRHQEVVVLWFGKCGVSGKMICKYCKQSFAFFSILRRPRVKNVGHLPPLGSTLGPRPSVFLKGSYTPFLRPLKGKLHAVRQPVKRPRTLPSSSTQYTSHSTHLGFGPR